MSDYKSIAVVVNFHSAQGSTRKEWESIKTALENHLGRNLHIYSTDDYQNAIIPTQNAIAEGADLLISVGGDGTHNEVANGILTSERHFGDVVMGVVPRGTGSDLRKTLKIPKDFNSAARLIASKKIRNMDVGKMTFYSHLGDKIERYFINILSVGLGGAVDYEVNTHSKILGGKISFMLGTIRALVNYKNLYLRVKLDGGGVEEMLENNFVIANGQYFGGGMWVAPHADPFDGAFDVITFGDVSKKNIVLNGTKIYSGKHLEIPGVRERRAKQIEIETTDNALLDVDGEQPGRAPLTAELIPSVLPIVCDI